MNPNQDIIASGEEVRRRDLEEENTEAASKVPIIFNLINWMVNAQFWFYYSSLSCKYIFQILFGMHDVFHINLFLHE